MFQCNRNSIGLSRICLGFILLLDLLIRCSDINTHYSSFGILPPDAMMDMDNSSSFSFHFIHSSSLFQRCLFLFIFICYFCFFIGYKTNISSFLSWISLISLHNRNVLILNSGDDLLRILMFWGLFLPLGDKYSIDKFINKRKTKKQSFEIASFAWKLQLSWMYIETYILKDGPLWLNGLGAYHALSDIQFTTSFGYFILNTIPYDILVISSKITLYIEILLPIFILFPKINCISPLFSIFCEIIQLFGVFMLILLHSGFGLCLEIGFFPFIPMIGIILCLPSIFWKYIRKHIQTNNIIGIYCGSYWINTIHILIGITNTKLQHINLLPHVNRKDIFIQETDTIEKTNLIDIISICTKYHIIYIRPILWILFVYFPLYIIISIFIPPLKGLILLLCFILLLFVIISNIIHIFKYDILLFILTYWVLIFNYTNEYSIPKVSRKLKEFICLLFIIYVILLVSQPYINNNTDNYLINTWDSISWIGATLRLDQYWSMFAPDPPSHTGQWNLIITINYNNNSQIQYDLFDNYCSQIAFGHRTSLKDILLSGEDVDILSVLFGYPISYCIPINNDINISTIFPSEKYKNQRWRKYFMNIRLQVFQSFSDYYMEFICNEWNNNLNKQIHGEINKVELLFKSEEITYPKIINNTIHTFRINTIYC